MRRFERASGSFGLAWLILRSYTRSRSLDGRIVNPKSNISRALRSSHDLFRSYGKCVKPRACTQTHTRKRSTGKMIHDFSEGAHSSYRKRLRGNRDRDSWCIRLYCVQRGSWNHEPCWNLFNVSNVQSRNSCENFNSQQRILWNVSNELLGEAW